MTKTNRKKQPAQEGFTLISDEKLLALYAALLMCRMIGRKMGARGKQNEASLAAAVAVAMDLLAGDTLAASRAEAMARLVKSRFTNGAALQRILAGLSSGRRLSDAAALKAALRKTRANKGEKRTPIAVAFCGGPKIAPDEWRKPLRAAAKKRLPILFVASEIPESLDVASFALPRGFPAIVVDRNDVVAMYRVASEAIAHARRGNGPTLILCRPWPLQAHDPIAIMEKYLASKRLFSARFKAKTMAAFTRQLRQATHTPNSARKK